MIPKDLSNVTLWIHPSYSSLESIPRVQGEGKHDARKEFRHHILVLFNFAPFTMRLNGESEVRKMSPANLDLACLRLISLGPDANEQLSSKQIKVPHLLKA